MPLASPKRKKKLSIIVLILTANKQIIFLTISHPRAVIRVKSTVQSMYLSSNTTVRRYCHNSFSER